MVTSSRATEPPLPLMYNASSHVYQDISILGRALIEMYWLRLKIMLMALQSHPNMELFPGKLLPIAEYLKSVRVIAGFSYFPNSSAPEKDFPILWPRDRRDIVMKEISKKSAGYIVVSNGSLGSDIVRELAHQSGYHDDDERKFAAYNLNSVSRFPLSSLKSRPGHFVTVRFIALGSLQADRTKHQSLSNDTKMEELLKRNLSDQYKRCFSGEKIGYECFRTINIHGRSFFSVEQHVKFWTYAVEAGNGPTNKWSGMLCSDFGTRSANPPWVMSPFVPRDTAEFLSPFSSDLDASKKQEQFYHRPNPFASRVADDTVMSQEDLELCTRDPFVFVADLLDTSALCWMQILSFLRDSFENLPDDPDMKMKLLGRDKLLLDRAIRYFTEIIRFIESRDQSRGRLEWPRCLEEDTPRVDAIARSLVQDYEILREDAQALSIMFQESTSIIMSAISVESSQQSLLESRRIQVITYLAFVFVPLGFIASFFGMNVAQLSDNPSIWFPVGAFIIALAISIVGVYWVENPEVIQYVTSKLSLYIWRLAGE